MITIYGRHDCQPCKATTKKCTQLGIEFKYIDLDAHPEAHAELARRGVRSLPFCETGNDHWAGYRPDKLTEHAERETP